MKEGRSPHWELWGKADPKRATLGPTWHPLICHILDVAACAEQLLLEVRPQRLALAGRALSLTAEEALPWMLFFIALHDLGKATPPFQRKVDERAKALRAAGFDFPESDEPHGGLSAVLVPPALEQLGVAPDLAQLVARAVGAHHGDFAEAVHLNDLQDAPRRHCGKGPSWTAARKGIVDELASILSVDPNRTPALTASLTHRHAFAVDLAGLTTAADWLGSDADRFGYVEAPESAESYFQTSRTVARIAIAESGFRRAPSPQARTFFDLFAKQPWPLHLAMTNVLEQLSAGSLVIVEAPMGEGKTEAALLAYDTMAARGADGLYFALPTQATANQILGRVDRFLASSFEGAQGLHLVHGGAGLSDRYDELKRRAFRLRSIGGAATSSDEAPMADAWFTRSKRALLAPFGVGTVDQALLAVLRAKHHFLRLHGLAGKVFVVDEVHAYDTFTSEILARLCTWLRGLGASVVLLSATLSSPQRKRLIEAYGATPPTTSPPYPRITVANDQGCVTHAFAGRRPAFDVRLSWRPTSTLFEQLSEALVEGGCVAWIVNTVARAQELFVTASGLMRAGKLPSDLDLRLLHARLPFEERLRRERAAETAFGPPGPATNRPRVALLIGTQVLEQSLDLDFDLMITELAPADLVLQRAGRLHRHDRANRPGPLQERVLWLELPEGDDRPDGPNFGKSEYVYDEEILLRSHLALRQRNAVALPTDIEPLVEQVYAPSANELTPGQPLAARIARAQADRAAKSAGETYAADLKLLPPPEDTDPFRAFSCRFDEEDPAVNQQLRATTRLGEASLTVVPVIDSGSALTLAADRTVSFDPNTADLDRTTAIRIARQAINVSHKSLVFALMKEHPRAFERNGALRHHRLLRLSNGGEALVGSTQVRLDPQLGLLIGKLASLATT